MKHSAKYTNRYGDSIEFNRVSEWEIEMLGGGSYIGRGSNMGRFDNAWEGLIVDYIDNNHILKLYEGRMVKAVVNDKEELRWYDASGDDYKTYNDIDEFLKERKHNEQQ